MVAFLYDFLYILPIYLWSIFVLGKYMGMPQGSLGLGVAAAVISSAIVGYKHIKRKYKIMSAGMLVAFVGSCFVLMSAEERMSLIKSYYWIILLLGVGLVSFAIGRLVNSYAWGQRLLWLIILAGFAIVLVRNIEIGKTGTACMYMLFIVILVQELQRHWKKSGYTDNKGHMVFLSPFILLVVAGIFFMPSPEQKYDWAIVDRVADFAKESAYWTKSFVKGDSEEYGILGFSDNGGMVAEIFNSDRDVMKLTADKNAGSVIYLVGKYFDSFNGQEWTSTQEWNRSLENADTDYTRAAVDAYDQENDRRYILKSSITIKYQDMETKHYFLPLKCQVYQEEMDKLESDTDLGFGTEYRLEYYRINKDSEDFTKMIEKLSPSSKPLQGYSQDLQLSYELRTALAGVYDQSDSDYVKLKKIEKWLKTFKYSTNPGRIPEEVNSESKFLDYLLLEKREGYCVHYATAFTLLARSLGRPARFAQGYYVNRGNIESVWVTSNMAHAWSEVYFDNVGWVNFEATPGYYRNTTWTIKAENNRQEMVEASQDEEKAKPKERKAFPWAMVFIPIGLVIGFLILYILVDIIYKRAKYKRLDQKSRVKSAFDRNIKIIKKIGFDLEPGETIEEFRLRIGDSLPESCTDFMIRYEAVIYGGDAYSQALETDMNHTSEGLLKELREKKGRLRYILTVINLL